MLVIAELLPKVQSLQASLSTTTANSAIIDMLRSANLDHVLPTATPLAPRPFMVCRIVHLLVLSHVCTNECVTVVRRLHRMAHITDLGRDLCARDDAVGDLEFDLRQAVLRQTCTGPPAADHRDGNKCGGRAAWPYGVDTVIEQEAVKESWRGTWIGQDVLYLCALIRGVLLVFHERALNSIATC